MFHFSGYRKKLCIRTVCQDFFFESLLSRSTENIHNGALLCSRTFLVSKNSMDQVVGAGDDHDFPSAFFCRTILIGFVGETLCVSEFLRFR